MRLIDALLATDPAERPDSAVDALSLVPSLEQQFRIERQIGELVSGCVAARAARDARSAQPASSFPSTPPAVRTSDRPGHTTSLPTPPLESRPAAVSPREGMRVSSTPPAASSGSGPRGIERGFDPSQVGHTTTEMPGLSELAGTDALMAARSSPGGRRSSSLWLFAIVTLALGAAAWLGLRYVGVSKPIIAVQPVSEPEDRVDDRTGSDGSARGLPTQPAAAKPTDSLEPHDEAESAAEQAPSPAPVILHEPGQELGSPRATRASESRARLESGASTNDRESRRARRGPAQAELERASSTTRSEPTADKPTAAAPVLDKPVAEKPAPAADKPAAEPKKHRAGISISSDDF